eukprot:4733269-Prymnesium_polylepis.1
MFDDVRRAPPTPADSRRTAVWGGDIAAWTWLMHDDRSTSLLGFCTSYVDPPGGERSSSTWLAVRPGV